MQTRNYLFCAIVAAVLFSATESGAWTLYPGTDNALFAERNVNAGYGIEALDSFVLPEGETLIGEIHFWGVYWWDVPEADDFQLKIYDNSYKATRHLPDKPANVIETIEVRSLTRTELDIPVGFTNLAGEEPVAFHYVAAIAPLTLSADVRYWLGISNDSGQGWGWLGVDGGTAHYRAAYPPNNTYPLVDEFGPGMGLSFYFTDEIHDVPEPSSVILGGLGAIAIGVWRRRRAGTSACRRFYGWT